MVDTLDKAVERDSNAGVRIEEKHQLKEVEHVEPSVPSPFLGDDEEDVPQLHARTWIAIAAFFLLNYVQVIALQGPSAVVCRLSFPTDHFSSVTAKYPTS